MTNMTMAYGLQFWFLCGNVCFLHSSSTHVSAYAHRPIGKRVPLNTFGGRKHSSRQINDLPFLPGEVKLAVAARRSVGIGRSCWRLAAPRSR